MKATIVCAICAVTFLMVGCGGGGTSANSVIGGDLASPVDWTAVNASVAGGAGHLISPDGSSPSILSQMIRGLEPHTTYHLSIRAKAATTPSAQLSIDLFSDTHGYDSEHQELVILPHEIPPTFARFSRELDTENVPEEVELRVFTFSTVRIDVDDIALTKK
jgi:hypothetical protein